MARRVNARDLEIRGLRLHVQLLLGDDPDALQRRINDWCAEAVDFLLSSELIPNWLKDELASGEPMRVAESTTYAGERLKQLTDRLHEFDDVEIRTVARRAFVSYVQDDAEAVDRIAHVLSSCGVTVWLDRQDLPDSAGLDWQKTIASQLDASAYFIVCFSEHWLSKPSSFAHEELRFALNRLSTEEDGANWFLPIQLTANSIPEIEIGPGHPLNLIQAIRMNDGWYRGCADLLDQILPLSGNLARVREELQSEMPDVRLEGVQSAHSFRNPRLLLPLLDLCTQEMEFHDYLNGGLLLDAIRAVRDIGRHDQKLSELALPVYVQLLDAGRWTYKVLEAMEAQPSQRVRVFLEVYKRNESRFGKSFAELLGDDDVFTIDLADLRDRAARRNEDDDGR